MPLASFSEFAGNGDESKEAANLTTFSKGIQALRRCYAHVAYLYYGEFRDTVRPVPIVTNQRWEKFAQLIASGETGAAAYRTCYGASGASAAANASRLIRKDKVRMRVCELRQQAAGIGSAEAAKTVAKAAGRTVLTLAKKRELLHAFATDRKLKPEQRMRAIELDAKLAGELKGDAATASVTVNNHVLTEARRAELIEMRRAAMEANVADAEESHRRA